MAALTDQRSLSNAVDRGQACVVFVVRQVKACHGQALWGRHGVRHPLLLWEWGREAPNNKV
jgi:hypothetical protein